MKDPRKLMDRRPLWIFLSSVIFGLTSAVLFLLSQRVAAARGTLTTSSPATGGPQTVLATIGDHPVTQAEVDGKVAARLYDLRKEALDEIIDDYVVKLAAEKAGLKPQEYLEQQVKLIVPRVTERDVEEVYNKNKAQIDAQTGQHSLDKVKDRLRIALQRDRDQEGQERIIKKLRNEDHIAMLLEAPHVKVGSAGHPSTGTAAAPVTIVEFSDFQCPFCRAAEHTLKQLRQDYGGQINLVYMDFPLNFHQHAMEAARAGRCAGDQDKFWQFHDALFLDQTKLDKDNLETTAAKIGLDRDKFSACLASDKHDPGIHQDIAEGDSLGVTGTPTFFVNGRELVGAQPAPKFKEVIDEELARAKKSNSSRQAMN
jgi:predicted DsbA family dithiol-disulfide isomerase